MLQMKISRMAESVDSSVKTPITLGTMNSNAAPLNIQNPDSNRPCIGILSADSFPSDCGAAFSLARPNSIRLVENTPLFAEESADVSTTKLTTAAAAGKPASEKRPTKGLLFAEIFCQEETEIMHTRERT